MNVNSIKILQAIMDQTIINAIIGGFGAALAFILKVVWEGVELTSKLSEVQLLVAGNYVRREDLESSVKALFAKLDKIEDKLDKKADRL